jgi:hypothetical protein
MVICPNAERDLVTIEPVSAARIRQVLAFDVTTEVASMTTWSGARPLLAA